MTPNRPHKSPNTALRSIYDCSTMQEDFNVFDSDPDVRSVCDPETGVELIRFHVAEESVS